MEIVEVTKLVHGGQGLGELSDGRKVFVWNALPGEKVKARIIRNKKSYAEAIAEEILTASPNRIEPVEKNYLATSPWQIVDFETENYWKKEITRELFTQAGVNLPNFEVQTNGEQLHYRNKMEYSFWGDDDGLHLALHRRGSHGKEIVTGSKLAIPSLDKGANALLGVLKKLNTRAGDLKTLIVRANQKNEVVAALYVKVGKFPNIKLPSELKGLRVYHSNPKSPASVLTKLLFELGDVCLEDELLGKRFAYDVNSFFQVNVPVFEIALERMRAHATEPDLTDMYAGVGSIGLSLASRSVDLIELDVTTSAMARINAEKSGIQADVIEASTEKALDYIRPDRPVIFDPPRAGLHDRVTSRVLEALPPNIIYLSCNPATQARDIAKLQEIYKISHFEIFNFFPRTPHIESLVILARKQQ